MMSLFHLSSESSHPSQSGKSLREAVLDSSSARDLIPEQYRVHFDELRKSIFAFCDEFHIPREALSNKEAFGAELNSKKISEERMAKAVSLFARLEHLITHGEPLKETPSENLEEAERLYHLREQYDAQVALLELVDILRDGAITGVDGNQYPIPTLEQIAEHLCDPERREFFETKRDQGFTKLLLVPFGMSLNDFISIFGSFLSHYKEVHPHFNLDTDEPFCTNRQYLGADQNDSLVYGTKSFDSILSSKSGDNGGKTKIQVLKDQEAQLSFFSGWRIHLFQPSDPFDSHSLGFASIPQEGAGATQGTEIPRHDLEAGKSPKEYLSLLVKAQDDPKSPYYGESGMTPEDWMIASMIHITETGEPLDDFQMQGGMNYLIGAFFSRANDVPLADWHHDSAQAALSVLLDSKNRFPSAGVRSSVLI